MFPVILKPQHTLENPLINAEKALENNNDLRRRKSPTMS